MGNSTSNSVHRRSLAVADSSGDNRENKDWKCDRCEGWPCACPNTVGLCSCPQNAAPLSSCVFYSPRIWGLLDGRRTQVDIARDHWTVVDAESAAELETVGKENRKYFDEVLVNHPQWGAFFGRFEDLEVGAKIGEGGQAEIFAASSKSFKDPNVDGLQLVAKVWKEGVSLRDLEQQWPPQMLSKIAQGKKERPFWNLYGGAFIRDGELKNRFAFVMQRHRGDLRTFLDERMLELVRNDTHGAPFNNIRDVLKLILEASNDLQKMHERGVLHRDIKASNVLLSGLVRDAQPLPVLIDYEYSVGVTGTGFWRAPEILEQVNKGVPSHEVVLTAKADIYSFGMLCYEVITGCIPFENHPQNSDFSFVLGGDRPELPDDLNLRLKELILDCWHHHPYFRPTSGEICERLKSLAINLGMDL